MYKNPEDRKKYFREWEARNREKRNQQKRELYKTNADKERQRNKKWKHELIANERCVNCARPRDREGKTLCSVCAPKFAKSVKAYNDRQKVACFEAYGGCKCACCGESHMVFLSIDHINGGGAAHRSKLRGGGYYGGGGGWRMYRHLKLEGYPPGYRVLCFNCNQAFAVLGYCPHKPPS